jgi:hypothetical protein
MLVKKGKGKEKRNEPTELRMGILAQEKGRGNRKSFYFRNLF